ncbi:coil containing protein [Vibrio phage 2.275.O._10N.286.54.E11]|nr:coil containing protein [Vibrio phage 2.275.O._10N.286.54.E11]
MTAKEELRKIVQIQFNLYQGAMYFYNEDMFFCWDEARTFCDDNDLDSTDLVDAAAQEMTNRYIRLVKKLRDYRQELKPAKVNADYAHSAEVKKDWAENVWHRAKYVQDKCVVMETILRDMEPMVSMSFTDDEVVYYSLTYLE